MILNLSLFNIIRINYYVLFSHDKMGHARQNHACVQNFSTQFLILKLTLNNWNYSMLLFRKTYSISIYNFIITFYHSGMLLQIFAIIFRNKYGEVHINTTETVEIKKESASYEYQVDKKT